MAPWLSSERTRKKSGPTSIEVIPDRDYVLIKGGMGETRDDTVTMRGYVHVKTTEECIAKHGVHIDLVGRMHIQYYRKRVAREHDSTPPSVYNHKTFYEEGRELVDPDTGRPARVMKPGDTYLYYEFRLPGDTYETVAGLGTTGIVWHLRAYMEKTTMKVLGTDMSSKKIKSEPRQMRVVRTLGQATTDELYDKPEINGSWEGKCHYRFGSTARAIPFGSQIDIYFNLTPHKSKLTVEKITVELKEKRKVKTWAPPPDVYRDSVNGWWTNEENVVTQEFRLPGGSTIIDPETFMDAYKANFVLKLPEKLQQVRQTIEEHPNIRIKHELHFHIHLLNPEGHHSQINALVNLRLFISEHRPLDASDTAHPEQTHMFHTNEPSENTLEAMTQAPPTYADRVNDFFLDSESLPIRTPGTMTPYESGAMSPVLNSGSRSGSYNNLSGLANASQPGSVHPRDLREALADLRSSGNRQTQARDVHQISPDPSRNNSVAMPGAGPSPPHGSPGYERGLAQSRPIGRSTDGAWNVEELSRIASYDTAMRTPARSPDDEPPSYDYAISRPPSPQH